MSAVVAASIPAELRALRQWTCWKLEPAQPKPKKMPYTITGGRGSVSDPAKWATFDECAAAVSARGYTGVGFIFTHGDPYVGVDLDGMTWAEAEPMVHDLLPAYVEVSQSGKGIHVICKGTLPPGARRKGPIECYEDVRYFAITGNIVGAPIAQLDDRTTALAAFHAKYLGALPEPSKPGSASTLAPEDQALLDHILATPGDGRRLHVLYYAGESNPAKESEADFDLACLLCRATADDAQVERLMWASALKRKKWTDHRTYLAGITIRNARVGNPPPKVETAVALPPMVDFGALHDNPPPDRGWLVENIWPELARGWVAGEPKLGKSWLAMELALAVATQEKFLRQFPIPKAGRVFYLTEESSEAKVLKRFHMLCKGRDLDPDRLRGQLQLYVRKGVKLTDPKWLAHLLAEQARLRPALVVFDPLRRYHSNPENQAHDMAPVLEAAARVQDGGSAVAIVHHMRKTGETNKDARPSQQMRGSSDLGAWHDAALYCVGKAKVTDRMMVEPEFKDEAAVEPFEVVTTYAPAAVALTVGTAKSPEGMQAADKINDVLQFLFAHDSEPQPMNAVVEGVEGTDKVIRAALRQAVQHAWVQQANGPNRSKLNTLTAAGRVHAGGASTADLGPSARAAEDAGGAEQDLPF